MRAFTEWGDLGGWRAESYLQNAFTAAASGMGGIAPVRLSPEFNEAAGSQNNFQAQMSASVKAPSGPKLG